MDYANNLEALNARVAHDLALLNYPPPAWLPPQGEDGTVLDVLIVGAGMCGQTAAFACLREGLTNIAIIDRAPRGDEGPWATFARMETLRSPKHLTGPDLGVPSLTYRAWYEAQHGELGWARLYKVPRVSWRDYLLWVRERVGIDVHNDTALVSLTPSSAGLVVVLRHAGTERSVRARKVVLALGRDGSGALRWPTLPSFDPSAPRTNLFHASEMIAFDVWKGKRVAVLGAGASAFDNAATALEHGAASVDLYVRRPQLPQVNKSKWTAFPGFFHGFYGLSDEARWRFLTHVFDKQVPPPFESVLRCDRHTNFTLRLGEGWRDLRVDEHEITITTAHRQACYDTAIIATGFDVDLLARPEVAAFRNEVDTWARHVSAEEAARHPEEARFPYLGAGFELLELSPDQSPQARNVHIFNWGCAMSHGQLAGDIPGLATGATRLAHAVASDLFKLSQDALYARLLAHREPELKTTRYYVDGCE